MIRKIEGDDLVFIHEGKEIAREPILEKTKSFVVIQRLAGTVTSQKIPMSKITS